jgi:hypothetical protein
MKKIVLTLAIVLGLGMASFADPNGGGMFGRGETQETRGEGNSGSSLFAPALPAHGQSTNQPAPLGSGIALLTACGAAYLVAKKRKED